MSNPTLRRRRGGFTLIELLAAMAILALLASLSITFISRAKATANETACSEQLRDMVHTLNNVVDTRLEGKYPRTTGLKFLLLPVHMGIIDKDALKKYACPGTDDTTVDPNDVSKTVGSGIKDPENINTDCISYAGRDTKEHALRKDKLDQEIFAADDNWFAGQGRPNHGDATIIVFGDGHIGKKLLSNYKAMQPEGQDWLTVGPGSPDDDLKLLTFE